VAVGDDGVDRVDDVIGAERIAVVERDAGAQREVDRLGVHLLPGRGEQRTQLIGVRIAIDQPVPHMQLQQEAGPLRIVVEIHVGQRVAPGDAQRVVRLLGGGRPRRQQRRQRHPAQQLAHMSPSEH
jgi:hypothetical protein